MKKFCALLMTLFYLLLSTGAYACLLHCTTDYLATRLENKQKSHISGNDHPHDEKEGDDDCKKGDCNCCYHHGNYVIKENEKVTTHFVFQSADFVIAILHTGDFPCIALSISTNVSWPRATGPPFLRSQPLYISNKTFLI